MLVPCLPTWCCWPCHDFFTGLWTSMNWHSPWPALFIFGTAIEGLDFKNLLDWDFYQGQHSQCRPARLGPVLLGLYWTLGWWRPLLRRLICRLALPSPQCEAQMMFSNGWMRDSYLEKSIFIWTFCVYSVLWAPYFGQTSCLCLWYFVFACRSTESASHKHSLSSGPGSQGTWWIPCKVLMSAHYFLLHLAWVPDWWSNSSY